jgi:signal transduction histidine kinase
MTVRQPLLVSLIGSSLMLIVVLQVFWLRSAYDDAVDRLRKDTENIFRATGMDLQDSLLRKNMKPTHDSMPDFSRVSFMHPPSDNDFDFGKKRGFFMRDSLRMIRFQVQSSSEQNTDSLIKIVSGTLRDMRRDKNKHDYNFVIRLNGDSIKITDLSHRFADSLSKAGIDLPFQVIKQHHRKKFKPEKGFVTGPFFAIPPNGHFVAWFPEYRRFIIGQILPQMMFSLFLTAMTATTFFVVFRSLKHEQELTRLKNNFIGNITHELKTPITTVGVALEAMTSFNTMQKPEQMQEYLDISKKELSRLSILVDNILKTAVFEQKGIVLNSEAIDFRQLSNQVCDSMKLIFEKQNARVKLSHYGENFEIQADSVHLTNVLYNLLDNALKYSPIQPDIELTMNALSDKVVFSVVDNGIGIPAEYQKKIFEKFFRVPNGNIHNTKGYGLGLTYVAEVIKKHGGLIEVNSEPGEGSCFTITMPRCG